MHVCSLMLTGRGEGMRVWEERMLKREISQAPAPFTTAAFTAQTASHLALL